jgi:hypothetical protein
MLQEAGRSIHFYLTVAFLTAAFIHEINASSNLRRGLPITRGLAITWKDDDGIINGDYTFNWVTVFLVLLLLIMSFCCCYCACRYGCAAFCCPNKKRDIAEERRSLIR